MFKHSTTFGYWHVYFQVEAQRLIQFGKKQMAPSSISAPLSAGALRVSTELLSAGQSSSDLFDRSFRALRFVHWLPTTIRLTGVHKGRSDTTGASDQPRGHQRFRATKPWHHFRKC